MSLPRVVSRDEWLVARKELLAEEKALTRARDALSAQRRRLPMVQIDKGYVFEGPSGKASLHARDTTMAVVSRAPIAKIERFKASKGWTFPWYSAYGSDFNYDFHVTLDESVAPVEYNYRDAREWAATGLRELPRELHGYLDMTALGRQEDWEEPKGRSTGAPRADQVGAGRT